ncbi:MAG: division/cell wall cluster transcriptional repressor MraZ [Proteobacteria bacterium]|nr:division/cell wall cluster transcriptional repressor MraZ [Pseudomonadota bacterium]MBU1711047.1 division/cell wall cluster transcriptional repressor MraZ [Pseudomonadota bacterium]
MSESVLKRPVNHFRGRSDHALDGKGRLNIATRFREVLNVQYDERLMITPWKNCLKAYPVTQWEAMEMALRAEGKKQPAMINLIRYMIGGVVECSLDKQGRILLPPKLREDCRIQREVVVNGMITYFEIWDKETWEVENKPTEDNFQNFEQTLLELGLF